MLVVALKPNHGCYRQNPNFRIQFILRIAEISGCMLLLPRDLLENLYFIEFLIFVKPVLK
jgi:hypothetical protein